MLQSLREETEGKLQMPLSPRKTGRDSLFKEVRVFKVEMTGVSKRSLLILVVFARFLASTAKFRKANVHRRRPELHMNQFKLRFSEVGMSKAWSS